MSKVTKPQILAFEKLFDYAESMMSNRGCNDIDKDILAMFTSEELSQMAKGWHEWNGDPEEWSEGDYTIMQYDWAMFTWIFIQIKEQILKDIVM